MIKVRALHTIKLGKLYNSKESIVLKEGDSFEFQKEHEKIAYDLARSNSAIVFVDSIRKSAELQRKQDLLANQIHIPEKNHVDDKSLPL